MLTGNGLHMEYCSAALVSTLRSLLSERSASLHNGSPGDMWLEGTFVFEAMVLIANFHIFYESYTITTWVIILNVLSTAFFYSNIWF